jgi:hypothetical protein
VRRARRRDQLREEIRDGVAVGSTGLGVPGGVAIVIVRTCGLCVGYPDGAVPGGGGIPETRVIVHAVTAGSGLAIAWRPVVAL